MGPGGATAKLLAPGGSHRSAPSRVSSYNNTRGALPSFPEETLR
jgi:hypothetical protein